MKDFINKIGEIVAIKRDNEKLHNQKLKLEIQNLENPKPLPKSSRGIDIFILSVQALATIATLVIALIAFITAQNSGLFEIKNATLELDKKLLLVEIADFTTLKANIQKSVDSLKKVNHDLDSINKDLNSENKTLSNIVGRLDKRVKTYADSVQTVNEIVRYEGMKYIKAIEGYKQLLDQCIKENQKYKPSGGAPVVGS